MHFLLFWYSILLPILTEKYPTIRISALDQLTLSILHLMISKIENLSGSQEMQAGSRSLERDTEGSSTALWYASFLPHYRPSLIAAQPGSTSSIQRLLSSRMLAVFGGNVKSVFSALQKTKPDCVIDSSAPCKIPWVPGDLRSVPVFTDVRSAPWWDVRATIPFRTICPCGMSRNQDGATIGNHTEWW